MSAGYPTRSGGRPAAGTTEPRLVMAGDGWRRLLAVGDEVRFGRGGPGVDVVIADDAALHRHCGTVEVGPDHWVLRNTGRWLRIRVVSLDRPGVAQLLPGDVVAVPWPSVRVEVWSGDRCVRFTAVHRRECDPSAGPSLVTADDDATVVPFSLSRTSGAFRALVALCEPQLVDPTSHHVPTDAQVAARLNRLPVEPRRVTAKTVERRLDHCRVRFRLKGGGGTGGAGLEQRDARRRLVEVALLTGAVSAGDLDLLDPSDDIDAAATGHDA